MACTPHDDAIAHTGGGSTSRQTATSPAEDEVRRYRSQGARPPVLGLRDTIALAPETIGPHARRPVSTLTGGRVRTARSPARMGSEEGGGTGDEGPSRENHAKTERWDKVSEHDGIL